VDGRVKPAMTREFVAQLPLPHPCPTITLAPTGTRLVRATMSRLNRRMPPLENGPADGPKTDKAPRV